MDSQKLHPCELNTRGANLRGIDDGYLWAAPSGSGHLAPCGARGLVGNVIEWLAWEDHDLSFRHAAGLGWSDTVPDGGAQSLLRFDPEARGADLGFRCVLSLQRPAYAPALESRITHERDGASMDLIKAGAHTVVLRCTRAGRGTRRARTKIEREFELPAFYVDRTPVSIGRYVRYLEASQRPVPLRLRRANPKSPVTAVSWEEAEAYAAWAGKRLCTEVEWLAAGMLGAFEGVDLLRPTRKRTKGAKPDSPPEWCADTWHSGFLGYANRHAPLNRWTPTQGHVVREGLWEKRDRCSEFAIGFRTAFTAQSGETE